MLLSDPWPDAREAQLQQDHAAMLVQRLRAWAPDPMTAQQVRVGSCGCGGLNLLIFCRYPRETTHHQHAILMCCSGLRRCSPHSTFTGFRLPFLFLLHHRCLTTLPLSQAFDRINSEASAQSPEGNRPVFGSVRYVTDLLEHSR